MTICVKLNDNGFFTNFNGVVDWLAFGDEHGIDVGVDWSLEPSQAHWDFGYGDPGAGNLWESFFAPIPCPSEPKLVVDRARNEFLGGFRGYALYNGVGVDMDAVRRRLNRSLERHVRLAPDIAASVEDFVREHFTGYAMIGIHLRNPAGSRGLWRSIPSFDVYMRHLDAVIRRLEREEPSTPWRIFAASDRAGLIERLEQRHPGRVVKQSDILRAADDRAEIHAAAASPSKDKRRLGIEVITDCWLLARCRYLVCVQSGVCTAAAFINPALRIVQAQRRRTLAFGRVEYAIMKAYCDVFEPYDRHPQLTKAEELAQRG